MLTTLFAGTPIPVPPRIYVHGVDRVRPSDVPMLEQFERELVFIAWICAIPNSPFFERFVFRKE